MARTIVLALKHNVSIGAHPGYPDVQGFGRRSLPFSAQQIENLVEPSRFAAEVVDKQQLIMSMLNFLDTTQTAPLLVNLRSIIHDTCRTTTL